MQVLYAVLATCSPAHTHMCRFLLGETMRPLLDELFHWTHSAEGKASSSLSMLCKQPYRHRTKPCRGSDDNSKTGQLPFTDLHLELPEFLMPLHDTVLTTGIQMRFMASLLQCKFTMQLLTDSALRQVQSMRSGVRICREEPVACMEGFGNSSTPDVVGTADDAWGPTIGWHAQAVQHASAATQIGIEERQAAVQNLITELSDLRMADVAGVVRERVKELQKHLRDAQIQEQRQLQVQHEERKKRAEELYKQRTAAEEHQARGRVCPLWCCARVLPLGLYVLPGSQGVQGL